jgi:hypothetical protein
MILVMPQKLESNEIETPRYVPEKVLFNWTAKSRPYKKRSRQYWVSAISIASLLGFVLFLAEGVMPVILVSSVVFFFFILSNVQPTDVTCDLTDIGVRVLSKTTPWENITRYWFEDKADTKTVVFQTLTFPGRIEFVVLPDMVEKIRKILTNIVPEDKPSPTIVDKATNWISQRLPES